MKYAIVFSSQTGNTQMLAEKIRAALPAENCLYFGKPDAAALAADRIYAGFWTNQGTCDAKAADFLKSISKGEVYLFGTAGFGGMQSYFDKILQRTAENLCSDVSLIGSFMCQGKMPMSVRRRYEKMQNSGDSRIPNVQGLIDNFDRALTHPDPEDLDALAKSVRELP